MLLPLTQQPNVSNQQVKTERLAGINASTETFHLLYDRLDEPQLFATAYCSRQQPRVKSLLKCCNLDGEKFLQKYIPVEHAKTSI